MASFSSSLKRNNSVRRHLFYIYTLQAHNVVFSSCASVLVSYFFFFFFFFFF